MMSSAHPERGSAHAPGSARQPSPDRPVLTDPAVRPDARRVIALLRRTLDRLPE
jgi:hypothetical protein